MLLLYLILVKLSIELFNISSSDNHNFLIIHSSLNVLVQLALEINSVKLRNGMLLTNN